MGKRRIAIWIFSILILGGCVVEGTSQTSPPALPQNLAGDAAAQATIQQRAAEDAAATLRAISADASATSYAATRVFEQATEQAAAVAMATSGAATATAESRAALATEQALAFNATSTAIWMAVEGTRQMMQIQATGTAEARLAQIDEMIAADEARRIAQLREAEAIRQQRQRTWNAMWPWLLGAGSLILAGVVVMVGVAFWRRYSANPIQIVQANGRDYPLIQSRAGDWQFVGPRVLPANEPLMLSDGQTAVAPHPLPPLPDGHVLILSETRGGKSTTMRSIIKARQNVIVLDPHYTAGDWLNATVIGGGRDFEAIIKCLEEAYQEMDRRFQVLRHGPATFDPITIVTDEMPALMQSECGSRAKSIWPMLVREAYKVNVFVVVSTQSTRVKTLGIEGEKDVLENFKHQFVLGRLARQTYPELTSGMERPAVLRSEYDEPKPIIIPYIAEEDPRHPAFQRPSSSQQRPLFVAPSVNGSTRSLDTEWGRVEGWQIDRVLEMDAERDERGRRVHSGRDIEKEVFGYAAGTAYYMRTEVMKKYGATATKSARGIPDLSGR